MSPSSGECSSESDANISSVMSQSVKFLLVVILLNALPTWHNPDPALSG